MSLIHINSEDFFSGTSYNGVWNFPSGFTGTYRIKAHHIETGDIPFIYPGCDRLYIREVGGGNFDIINFPEISSSVPATVAGQIAAAFDASVYLAGTAVVYNAVTNAYDVTVSANIDLLWDNVVSSSYLVFKKNRLNELNVLNFSLSARLTKARPKFLEFHIQQTASQTISGNGTKGDFLISTFDEEVRDTPISFDGTYSQLDCSFRRVNVPGVPCPLTLQWDIILESSF